VDAVDLALTADSDDHTTSFPTEATAASENMPSDDDNTSI